MDAFSKNEDELKKHQLAVFKLLEHSLFQGFDNSDVYVNLYGYANAVDPTANQYFGQQVKAILKIEPMELVPVLIYYYEKEIQKYLTSMGDDAGRLLKSYLVFCAWNQYISGRDFADIVTHEKEDRAIYIEENHLSVEEQEDSIKDGQFGYQYVKTLLRKYTNVDDKIYLELARGKDRYNSFKKRDEYKYICLLDERIKQEHEATIL